MRVLIQNDLYDISGRIKYIDPDYKIFYNTNRGVFEVHNTAQAGSSYCLSVPYGALDERTLKLVHKTRAQNAEKILNEIEKENRFLEEKMKNEILDATSEKIQKALKE